MMATRDGALRMLEGAAMTHTATWTGALLLATVATYYLYRGFVVRSRFQRLQRQGVPMIPHHPVFGHLGTVGRLMATKLPADAHGNYMSVLIQDYWRELCPAGGAAVPPAVYVDLWPFSPPFLVSLHGDVSAQFTQDHNPDHPDLQGRMLRPLTGGYDVAASNGDVWAARRRALNPAFSPANVAAHVPGIADEVGVLVRKLKARAGKDGAWGRVFALQDLTTRLALDVMYRFSVGVRVGDQDGADLSPVSSSLVKQIKLLRFHTNISTLHQIYSPVRGWNLWRNGSVVDSFLLSLIRARFGQIGQNESEAAVEKAGPKTLLDVLAEQHGKKAGNVGDSIRQALGETKHSLFAGHETTSFTLCTVLNMLAQHPPHALARMRAEVDGVLQGATTTPDKDGGTHDKSADDPTGLGRVIQQIRESPHLLNGLVYTTAVIKETMRLETNVGTLRAGRAGFSLHGPASSGPYRGVEFPTEGCILMDGSLAIHRGAYAGAWGEAPLEFAPERWLTGDGDSDGEKGQTRHLPAPPRNVYRPFALGPRNCVGQHLAMTEIRLATALVVRELDVECAWDEWDEMIGNKGPNAKKPMALGSRLYQIGRDGVPQLKDGMPVHVRLRLDKR
ncbi:hypothetical protein RB595_000192 [Gaeumannomyces hyphopodioides]